MSLYTVGSVPYVNAIPLTRTLEQWESKVQVLYAVPSQLPALLEGGDADAILVSSVDALRTPGRRMAMGTCIGSDGPVKSVRLFSKVAPGAIRTLALDASSMTSNRLAQIVLAEAYEVSDLKLITRPPNLESMLAEADACVLIGDIGMTTDGADLHVLDLGEEWRRLTGKPFVWAAWIGGERLTSELALLLAAAAQQSYVGRDRSRGTVGDFVSRLLMPRWHQQLDDRVEDRVGPQREALIAYTVEKAGWTEEAVRDYYMNVMVYDMDETMLDGFREFQRRLLRNGFADAHHFPEIVRPEDADSGAFQDWLTP